MEAIEIQNKKVEFSTDGYFVTSHSILLQGFLKSFRLRHLLSA